MENTLIPPKSKGKNTDLREAVTLTSRTEALDCFKRASKRMLNPPVWHELTGKASAAFQLMAPSGKTEHRLARQGDYLKIDIPGPGPSNGDGYDWVRIELIEERPDPKGEEETIGMKLRSSARPGQPDDDTAHFFGADATSSFLLRRSGNTVTVSYHGRNEKINSSAKKTADKIRNSIVGLGAVAGLSELQWSTLIKAFLQEEIGG